MKPAALRTVAATAARPKKPPLPKPPKHLAAATRRWWASVIEQFDLEEHHRRLLTAAAEAWDRAEEARGLLAEDGLVIVDRFGQQKPHPAAVIARDSAMLFGRLLRELDLDGAPEIDRRPPRLGRNR